MGLLFLIFPGTVYLHTYAGSNPSPLPLPPPPPFPQSSFEVKKRWGWVGVRLESHLCLFPALWQANVHPDAWMVSDSYLMVSGCLYSPHGICSVAACTRVLIMWPFGSATRGQRRPSRSRRRPTESRAWKKKEENRKGREKKKSHITLVSLKWPRKRSWKWMALHQSCQSCFKAKFDCGVRCLSASRSRKYKWTFFKLVLSTHFFFFFTTNAHLPDVFSTCVLASIMPSCELSSSKVTQSQTSPLGVT